MNSVNLNPIRILCLRGRRRSDERDSGFEILDSGFEIRDAGWRSVFAEALEVIANCTLLIANFLYTLSRLKEFLTKTQTPLKNVPVFLLK